MLLGLTTSQLQKTIKNVSSEKARFGITILNAIRKEKPDLILGKLNLNDFIKDYEKYKFLSFKRLERKLSKIRNLPVIDILIIFHLISKINKGSKIVWPDRRYKITNIPTLVLTPDIYQDMNNFVNGLISALPEANILESVSQWAERKRVLSGGVSAYPGPYSFDKTPYLREIADCLSDTSPIIETVLMKGTQIGATTGILENMIGYCIDYGIGPVLFVSGDQAMAEDSMEKRIDQMIESAGLQWKIKPAVTKRHQKATGDRKEIKSYGGTFIRAIGPNSESKARTFPARIALIDEIDVYPAQLKGGGDIIEKILRRMDSFGPLKKVLYLSTPKKKSTSRIYPLWEAGDKRYYNISCTKCGFMQPLVFSQIKFGKRNKIGKLNIKMKTIKGVEIIFYDPIYYECIKCKTELKNYDKTNFMSEENGAKWIPTKKADRPGLRSYFLPSLYSPVGFLSWLDIAIHFERVKDDVLLLPDFINDILGEPSEEKVSVPDQHILKQNAEDWELGYIHRDVIFLTLTADIQADRIEVGLVGWAREKQAYFVNYWNLPGDTLEIESECWKDLAEKINNVYKRSDGVEMNIQIAFIDCQYLKDQVDKFCDQFNYFPDSISGVYPIIARESLVAGVTTKIMKSDIKTPIIGLSDQKLKRALYNTLRKKPHKNGFPFGYIHFSKDYGNEFYKQLTSEEIFVTIKPNGQKIIKIENRKQRRNEVFDIAKYQIGAYQFAINRYFEILNEKRKIQKLKPIQNDTEVFMTAMEEILY